MPGSDFYCAAGDKSLEMNFKREKKCGSSVSANAPGNREIGCRRAGGGNRNVGVNFRCLVLTVPVAASSVCYQPRAAHKLLFLEPSSSFSMVDLGAGRDAGRVSHVSGCNDIEISRYSNNSVIRLLYGIY